MQKRRLGTILILLGALLLAGALGFRPRAYLEGEESRTSAPGIR